ncbi:hypothetical protein [Streptomyces sp. 184]|uniref:hypothetical protein n=1 Tax=Streptomyces sp. 184 TaxID=1827526 RepID=UPI0038927B19
MPEKKEKFTTKGNSRPMPPTDEPDPNLDPTDLEPTKDDDSNGDLKPLGNSRP